MSSFKLNRPPVRQQPVVKEGAHAGFFDYQWEAWFNDVWNSLRLLTATTPLNIGFVGSYAGGGSAFTLSMNITVASTAAIYVTGTWLQQYVTTQPNWQVQLLVDATVIFDSALVSGVWQQVIAGSSQITVQPGQHTVTMNWTNSTANGTLTRANLVAFPELSA